MAVKHSMDSGWMYLKLVYVHVSEYSCLLPDDVQGVRVQPSSGKRLALIVS